EHPGSSITARAAVAPPEQRRDVEDVEGRLRYRREGLRGAAEAVVATVFAGLVVAGDGALQCCRVDADEAGEFGDRIRAPDQAALDLGAVVGAPGEALHQQLPAHRQHLAAGAARSGRAPPLV